MSMQETKKLLQKAHERWPTPEGIKHNLTLVEGDLVLTLFFCGQFGIHGWQQLRFNGEGDLDKTAEALLYEIVVMLEEQYK